MHVWVKASWKSIKENLEKYHGFKDDTEVQCIYTMSGVQLSDIIITNKQKQMTLFDDTEIGEII